jgi:splicing factor 1
MARGCPDRKRGSDWHTNSYGERDLSRAIGGGDAVDREMEVGLIYYNEVSR